MTHSTVHCIVIQCVDRLKRASTLDPCPGLRQIVHIVERQADAGHVVGTTDFVKDGDLVRVAATNHTSLEYVPKTYETHAKIWDISDFAKTYNRRLAV